MASGRAISEGAAEIAHHARTLAHRPQRAPVGAMADPTSALMTSLGDLVASSKKRQAALKKAAKAAPRADVRFKLRQTSRDRRRRHTGAALGHR